jgi:hypothetical protein
MWNLLAPPLPLLCDELSSAERGGSHAGTRSEAPHVGVHRRHRPPPHHGEEAPEEQERLRHQEGGGERPPRVHPLHRRGRRSLSRADGPGCLPGRWLEYQRARGIRSRTLDGYEGYIRREILPSIGGLELGKIRPGHVRAVLTRMQRRGLASATIAQVRNVVGSALRQAVEDGLIPANPVTAVKRPRVRRAELHWPTSAQIGALLQASQGTLWEVPILLAAVTGARRSEVLGISWEDVDLKTGTILIRRGVQPVRDAGRTGTAAFTPLKTKRARRVVQLLPSPSSGSGGTGSTSSRAASRSAQRGMTPSTRRVGLSPWCANGGTDRSCIQIRSPARSSGWLIGQGSIPPPACTTSVTPWPLSSAARASTP